MIQEMVLNEKAYFGSGAIHEIVNQVNNHGFKKLALFTDQGIIQAGIYDKISSLLKENRINFVVFSDIVPNPTIQNVLDGLAFVRNEGVDAIISVGGGSTIDTTKAVAVIMTNPDFEDVRSLEGEAPTKNPCLPIIAVPTTSGTAAEVTKHFVITDVENKRKFACVNAHSIPIASIVDNDLMLGMPKSIAAATGMDAMTHAIESYITKSAWEMTDAFSIKAIGMIGKNLKASVEGDLEARGQMAKAQYLAGMAFSNSGLGLDHGMAHPLSAWYNVPHGVACSILLPHILRYNMDATGEKYRDIAIALEVPDAHNMSLEDVREAVCQSIEQLSRDVQIPATVNDYGASVADIPALAREAIKDVNTPGNPRLPKIEEIEEIYGKIITQNTQVNVETDTFKDEVLV